jgi:hypothetical protein
MTLVVVAPAAHQGQSARGMLSRSRDVEACRQEIPLSGSSSRRTRVGELDSATGRRLLSAQPASECRQLPRSHQCQLWSNPVNTRGSRSLRRP